MTFFLFLLISGSGLQARDVDADGFPDAAELTSDADQRNFRRWFTTIALSRYLNQRDEITDCAGLIRYAYREALKKHDEEWRLRFGELLDASIPEIEAFHYPDVPLIGTDIFRIADGPYSVDDCSKGRFSNFADVPHLRRFHMEEIGRERSDGVKSGDLLFFAPEGRETHVMVFIILQGEPYLLYHTGPRDNSEVKDEGEMRLVKFETLMSLPDETWRPEAGNPAFVGFYRFKILD
ncbi:DUF1175 family protein [candidate division WOR-3 bacterium]|uniref:DUF1175 family protein n=1 Tax=candidate division WOR-3 bacterium TaxID=2052148 RepID=A0A9D5K8Q4_UNCW3|nr:DUF1175 family protein [candidate division WOR-3 bacterium]MBD3363700.1 DUF1175 family protein [candidate division WOR-3 bacterium]